MKWSRISDYCHAAGQYSCTKAWSEGRWKYCAWFGKKQLGVFENAADAKAACVTHSEKEKAHG